MVSTTDVVESYKNFLELKYPTHYKKYCDLFNSNAESAKAEAVTFSLLRSIPYDIKIAEDINTGGADFLCKSEDIEFIAEVTCLEAESVSGQSGWKNEVPKNDTSGSFRMITRKLLTKASRKAPQLSGYSIPRVLVITCEHIAADFLIGPHGAETFFTSDTRIEVPIGKPIDNVGLATDLKNAAFFKSKDGVIETCRRSISAILLISIVADKSFLVGILHPDPQYEFSIRLLPSVPFLRMRKGPPADNNIEIEWVIHKPKPGEYYHRKIDFKDEELRTI